MLDLTKYLNPDYPLLERFKQTAPGTYRHCQNVSNLVEAIALELHMDVNLLKVCALYHDIGKMFNPKYYVENQGDMGNPHDNLEPEISYQIITRHISDSVFVLLKETDIPREVLEVISEHHGSLKIYYFLC